MDGTCTRKRLTAAVILEHPPNARADREILHRLSGYRGVAADGAKTFKKNVSLAKVNRNRQLK
jgi:hypothetical protein